MTREELIKCIYDNPEPWSCPEHRCDQSEKGRTAAETCRMCAEKQLKEYEDKIRADERANVIDLIDRHLWNYSIEVWKDFQPILGKLKEQEGAGRRTKMKNYEKYLDLVIEAAAISIAVDKNGKPCKCSEMSCSECCFCSDNLTECNEKALEWLKAEYEEPKVDWSNVEVDTKVLVRNTEEENWKPRHFAHYTDGKVYAYFDGTSSFTASMYGSDSVSGWMYAKLYEGEQNGK